MFEHLSVQERKEMANVLESYTIKCEGTTQVLALDNGTILPPIPLVKFPTVRYVNLVHIRVHSKTTIPHPMSIR